MFRIAQLPGEVISPRPDFTIILDRQAMVDTYSHAVYAAKETTGIDWILDSYGDISIRLRVVAQLPSEVIVPGPNGPVRFQCHTVNTTGHNNRDPGEALYLHWGESVDEGSIA